MNGLIIIPSNFSVKETIDRIALTAQSKGLTIFARIDHSANAIQSGLELRPTELIIFGDPKTGTALMQDNQTSGIDLPIKVLAWQDATGIVRVSFNDAGWLKGRHSLSGESDSSLNAIQNATMIICSSAAKK